MTEIVNMGPSAWLWVDPARCKCRLEFLEFRSELTGRVNSWLYELLKLHTSMEYLILERTCMSEDSFILPNEPREVQMEHLLRINGLRCLSISTLWDFAVPRFVQWLEANFRFRADPVAHKPLCRFQFHSERLGRGYSPDLFAAIISRGLVVSRDSTAKNNFAEIYKSFSTSVRGRLPRSLVRSMRTLLLCHRRADCILSRLPKDVLTNFLFTWILRFF